MPMRLTDLSQLRDLPFDQVIDVRSPAEFAEDRVPGAINLPALSNDERARVGTIYVQDSPFQARKIGAALVSRNMARHIEEVLADKPRDYRPLVYCWRGGQRSGSVAIILQQIGWRAETIDGGYRSYRRLVQNAMHGAAWPGKVMILDGNTGTAKTVILSLLKDAGHQVLDLEALACHRGSIFGGVAGGQPAQKGFESDLAMAMTALDPARPLIVEAESSKIGDLNLPPAIWAAMKDAPRVEIRAPMEARRRYLLQSYGDISADRARLADLVAALSTRHSGERIATWQQHVAQGDDGALVEGLLTHHYDPRYARQRARWVDAARCLSVDLPDLSGTALAAELPRIAAAIDGASAL
ncbi:tRNA 2-selenouridine synthase [Actibacterium mucosum KCTC 23349]|uniref:tRNA 2-selenouridine synthase n=1 Tax=Actibacterium mucosum KCTC 23349 TaxID=1454373 RepID=A0A037ZJG3_9RHOB|nr:tRNA 2-selenouridine(34) synthase MnmH [Actibacterium mucosum]KAJ54931.1 tRNA 2-selenouridine synthase [Actibacterium mucosum KCTC 23349]